MDCCATTSTKFNDGLPSINSHSYNESSFPPIIEEEDSLGDTSTERDLIGGAALIGGAVGLLIGGVAGGVALAAGAALGTATQKAGSKSGDFFHATGKLGLNTIDASKRFDEKHRVTEKVKSFVHKTGEKMKEHKVGEKVNEVGKKAANGVRNGVKKLTAAAAQRNDSSRRASTSAFTELN